MSAPSFRDWCRLCFYGRTLSHMATPHARRRPAPRQIGGRVRRSWTPQEIEYVRDHYPSHDMDQIAAALSRTYASVKAFVKQHGLTDPNRRRFTPAEIDYVQAHKDESGVQVAKAIGRDHHAVLRLRERLGISKKNADFGPAFVAFLREKHAAGWSDAEIAQAWKCDRHAVGFRRRKLGLPAIPWSDHQQRRVNERTKEQCRRAGVESLAAIRSLAFKKYAQRAGLPEDLKPREVQIVNFLCRQGPSTRRQIAEGIGASWTGVRTSLTTAYRPEGTYLMHLINRGLVVNLGRIVKGKGSGHSTCLYSVPLTFERKFDEQQASQAG